MKLNVLFFTNITFLLIGFNNVSMNKNYSKDTNFNPIEKTGITSNFDTGTFYQIQPGIDDEYIEEYNSNTGSKINNLRSQYVVPTDPFEGDTYVPNKSFLTTYYSHLKQNMPNNSLGICGYTAISMFFSYYDTYWNDLFIPEQYDSTETIINSSLLYATSTYAYESPGVRNLEMTETIDTLKLKIKNSGITDEESIEFKEALDRAVMGEVYRQIDGGSFVGRLFEIGIANGSIKPHYVENEYHVANEGYVDGIGVDNDVMNNVISDYITGNSNLVDKVSVVTSKMNGESISEKNRVRSEIVQLVKSGRPVLMGGNGYTDKNNNGIRDEYPNLSNGEEDPRNEGSFGHVVVAYDYDESNDILYGNMGWSHGSQSHRNLDEYFNIQMSDYWTLKISSELPKNRTNNYIYSDKTSFYSPGLNQIYNIIKPQDYGFGDAYVNEIIEKDVLLSKTNETFITNRYRCGFIQGESINISTKRVNPGVAYLEYTFNKTIKRIEVDLAWWSSNEKVNSLNSNYSIELLIDPNVYFSPVDLWSDVNVSNDRNNPTKVIIYFPSGINTFRIYGETNSPINDRNKGRLSIFDLVVEYD